MRHGQSSQRDRSDYRQAAIMDLIGVSSAQSAPRMCERAAVGRLVSSAGSVRPATGARCILNAEIDDFAPQFRIPTSIIRGWVQLREPNATPQLCIPRFGGLSTGGAETQWAAGSSSE